MKFIGMDVHSTTTDICVINERGRQVGRYRVETTERELIQVIRGVDGPKQVVLEESQLADWVTRILSGEADKVIRCQPQHNALISHSEKKCDREDARKLAMLLKNEEIMPVHHPGLAYRGLREAVIYYWRSSQDLTRAKLRVKAYLLSRGVTRQRLDPTVLRHRALYRGLLQARGGAQILELLWREVDFQRLQKAQYMRQMRAAGEAMREDLRHLRSIPGVGPVIAHTLAGYLERGYRFRNQRQVWSYAGLAVKQQDSGRQQRHSASRQGNRTLKNAVMTAVMVIALKGGDHELARSWRAGIARGVDPRRMRRTLGRKLLSIAQNLLRSHQDYRHEPVNQDFPDAR